MEQFVSTFSASGNPPKETCRQCRFRKVRCDGKHGEKGCGDCERLKFDCSFVVTNQTTTATTTTTTSSSSGTSATAPTHLIVNTTTTSLPSPTGSDAGRVVERRRTSKACTHCRQQKVRCSGGTPCMACKKKGVSCVYGTDRRRSSRVATSSVTGTPTEATFSHHHHNNPTNDITFQPTADDGAAASTTSTTPRTTSSEPATVAGHTGQQAPPVGSGPPLQLLLLLPPDIQVLVEFYFRNVYPMPSYAFLHPQTTIRQCSEGELEISLSYAISAVASYHRSPPSSSSQVGGRGDVESSSQWVQAAEELIWKHLESPTLARLQALLLVVLYRVETGAFQRAFMLSSLAARAAAAMRLNHEREMPSSSSSSSSSHHHHPAGRISREVRRRVMWSLKLVERYFSVGLPEFELCPVDSIYLDLPCWEREFSSFSSSSDDKGQQQQQQLCVERNLQTCDFGSYHLCVKLEMLRRDMMKLTRSLAICDTPFPQLSSVMQDFEQHLERVGRELPNGLTLSAERIAQLIDTPWLPRRVLVYLAFHHSHCDLYRLLIRNYREAAPAAILDTVDPSFSARAEQLCLQHATAIVDILATLNQLSQHAQLLEFDTAICGYHAIRILLFIAQFSRSATRPSEEWALSRAELCIASLKRFFPTSKLVKPVLEEMRRAMTVFSSRGGGGSGGGGGSAGGGAGATTPSRLASPGPPLNATKDPSMGLSAAARVRQRLAIHSLLRQADFTDEEEGEGEREGQGEGEAEGEEQQHEGRVKGGGGGGGGGFHNQWAISPGARSPSTTTTSGAQGSGTDARLSRASSSLSLSSPRRRPSDAESWQLRWMGNGDFTDRWDPDIQPTSTTAATTAGSSSGGGGPPSFSFPWLQRLEAPTGGVNGI